MEKLIAWVEIPSNDFDRAVKFYNSLLSMELKGESYENEKMACFPTGEGAIIYSPGFEPSGQGMVVSFNTGNLDETIQKVERLGGRVVQPKTRIDAQGKGYFALFIDSEGNRVGLYGY